VHMSETSVTSVKKQIGNGKKAKTPAFWDSKLPNTEERGRFWPVRKLTTKSEKLV
jgi:hypothetical protein